jgi:hypothetical protein
MDNYAKKKESNTDMLRRWDILTVGCLFRAFMRPLSSS